MAWGEHRGLPKWTWTDADVAVLKEMWAAGKTDSAIVIALDVPSRNCVVGKITRLKLTRAPKAKHQRKITVTRRNPPARSEMRAVAIPVPVVEPMVERPAVVVDLAFDPCTITDLSDFSCRWPVGDPLLSSFRYCGAAKPFDGGPYCDFHAALARGKQPSAKPTPRGSFVGKHKLSGAYR